MSKARELSRCPNTNFSSSLGIIFFPLITLADPTIDEGLPLYYWKNGRFTNFGDYLSQKIVERIVGGEIRVCQAKDDGQKLLALGSILICARTGDVVWGTGMNGKNMDLKNYKFTQLDVKAVRGPLTRDFIVSHFDIECPEIYGDPALLIPYLFPEFKKKQSPEFDYLIIPHYSEIDLFPKTKYSNVIYPIEPWRDIVRKILNSRFVISGSLHGIIVAEAFGIPARYLRLTESEPLFKYRDYYLGTSRPDFQYATSIKEALELGGEPPFKCDLKKLYEAFPFEYWPHANFAKPHFEKVCKP